MVSSWPLTIHLWMSKVSSQVSSVIPFFLGGKSDTKVFVKGNSACQWIINYIWVDWACGKGKFSTGELSEGPQPLAVGAVSATMHRSACCRHSGSEPRVRWDGHSHRSTQQLGHPLNEPLSTHSLISFSSLSVLEETLLTVLPVPLTGPQSVILKIALFPRNTQMKHRAWLQPNQNRKKKREREGGK